MYKIILNKDQNAWFTSDPHYGHVNICKGTTRWRQLVTIDGQTMEVVPDNTRKFDTVEKMNDTIINNINNVVKENDWFICLGDWSFGGFDNIRAFRNRIVCKNIILVTGNHDEHIVENKDNIQSIFTKVFESGRAEITIVQDSHKHKFMLDHFPVCSWNKMARGTPLLHGHVHLSANQKLGQGKSLDVGVDGNNYKPYSLREINSIMGKQPIAPLAIPSDHHERTNVLNHD